MYAMDPRTTFPFWDYDVTPLYGARWIERMLRAVNAAGEPRRPTGGWTEWFAGPSVVRKELIYSLVDMKVSDLSQQERLAIIDFWIAVLRDWCGPDWLGDGSNRAPATDDVAELLRSRDWVDAGTDGGRAVGRLTVALLALSYALYSDVFAHQSGEARGPYEVAPQSGPEGSTLLIRSWTGLGPTDLWPGWTGPGFGELLIAAVYRDCRPAIDIYNHVSWEGVPARDMTAYCVFVDGHPKRMDAETLSHLAAGVAEVAANQFDLYESLTLAEKKRLWVRQRSHQFSRFLSAMGLPWEAPDMEAAVTAARLHRQPMWNTQLDRERLYAVWKRCLDPRNDVGYDAWGDVFAAAFPDAPSR
jgi:hypothetical protein